MKFNIDFNEEELYKLNIHDLRDLARHVGMISPTTKSKDELVSGILSIIYGETPKRETKLGAGRPAKNRKKTSKLLFELDENNGVYETVDNPFVKKYESNPEEIFKVSEELNDDEYSYMNYFNHYSDTCVASPKSEYKNDTESNESSKDIENTENIEGLSPELLEMGRKIRKLLGREYECDKKEPEVEQYEPKDCLYVTSFVFLGAEDKFYVAFPEIDDGNQKIYRLPDKLVKIFAIHDGDYVEGWVDPRLEIMVSVTAVNGYVVL